MRPCPIDPATVLLTDGSTLSFWMIGEQSIWIEVARCGAVTVNGDRVLDAVQIERALRGGRRGSGSRDRGAGVGQPDRARPIVRPPIAFDPQSVPPM
jgi:hypothetical protein